MSLPRLSAIAELSGLSPSTVSRVLRGLPRTSAASREAVARALRQLGKEPPPAVLYGPQEPEPQPGPVGGGGRPEATGSRTSTGAGLGAHDTAGGSRPHSRLLAVVSNALVGPDVDPYETVALALNRRIFSLGHIALRSTAGLPAAAASDLQTPFLQRGVSGAIVLGGSRAGAEALQLSEAGLPVVRVSNARHDGLPQFVLDASSGIATAVRHLVHMGHSRIGFAAVRNSAADQRISAFRREIARTLHVQATRAEAPVELAETGLLAGAQAAQKLLDRGCTAAISSAPSLTLGFLEATDRARLRIPEDFSLLTVGDIPDAAVLNPPMSQVTYDWAGLAESAVAALLRVVDDREARRTQESPADYAVAPELLLRDSVRPVRRR